MLLFQLSMKVLYTVFRIANDEEINSHLKSNQWFNQHK